MDQSNKCTPPHIKLRELRELRLLSQSQLAVLTGISQSNISALESGRRSLGKERAIVLAQVLKVHPAEILFSDYDPIDFELTRRSENLSANLPENLSERGGL